jgi:hypothetical protein
VLAFVQTRAPGQHESRLAINSARIMPHGKVLMVLSLKNPVELSKKSLKPTLFNNVLRLEEITG